MNMKKVIINVKIHATLSTMLNKAITVLFLHLCYTATGLLCYCYE